ncbi:MAG: FYDLN acid domain-containing protein [Myxococcota bacterium]
MIHPKFGTKYTCFSCSAKYYDLKKPEPKCPKCGADPREDPALKAAEKGSRKEAKEDAFTEEFENESFEADVDELVNDDDGDVEEEEPEDLGVDEEI